jgi:hypothetical protein
MSEILNNSYVNISTSTAAGAWDMSGRTMKLTLERDADEHDDTVMGMTAHSRVVGLESWQFNMGMLQSFSSADGLPNTNTLLRELYTTSKAGNKFLVEVRKHSTQLKGLANPTWTGLCVLKNYNPLDGEVGDLMKTDVTFLGSGNLSESVTSS